MQITEFLLALPALLFSMVAHEFAHGYAALRQGDDTAARLGRLTFNPVKHIDPWMTLILPLMMWIGSGGRMIFGGAKPVPVNPSRYRHPVRGDLIVSSAGIAANVVLVIVFAVLAALVGVAAGSAAGSLWMALQRMMFWGIWFNLLLANFNIIPIPPLDGSHLLFHALPEALRTHYLKMARFGILLLIAMLFFYPTVLTWLLIPAFAVLEVTVGLLRPFTITPFMQ